MNLRFSSDFTQSLGLERPVCEVQLVLLPYAKLKVLIQYCLNCVLIILICFSYIDVVFLIHKFESDT